MVELSDNLDRPEHRDALGIETRKAHVICIVYDIGDMSTFDRLATYWLPYIRSQGANVPVVLVGNKIDCRGGNVTNEALEDEMMPIMNEFKEVETCVECSAKKLLNVSEVFYFAQKAVLHPTAPLYDSREHTLKPGCIDALKRIFKLCDLNKDGTLNDDELNEFQRKCFGAPLKQEELDGVKEVVSEHQKEGVSNSSLTEVGFLYLHTLFIQRGRLETTWTVLRRFGYGDDLTLREDYLLPPMEVPPDHCVELSPQGYQFFTELFQAYDKDKDGALKQSEVEDLFSTSPGQPWTDQDFPNTTVTNDHGAVTLQGWLAQWSMTTLLDYKITLAYLAYLGYDEDKTITALKTIPTRPKKVPKKKNLQRSVFCCYVFGGPKSGKTQLLRSFINNHFSSSYTPTSKTFSAVNSVEIKGAEKYLVIREFGSVNDLDVLKDKSQMELCDVLCYVYDSSDPHSFAYLARLRDAMDSSDMRPTLFVATKSDQDLVQQRYDQPPDVYCRSINLPTPISVSVKSRQTADLFTILTTVAMNPNSALPGNPHDIANSSSRTRYYLTVGVVTGAVVATVYFAYRWTRQSGSWTWSWGSIPKKEL